MRIYELNPMLDQDINESQVFALDDSTQTRKISLAQIRKFLGVGENSMLIPTGTDIHAYFLTAKSGSYYGEGLTNTAQSGAWFAFDWSAHEGARGTLIETTNSNELGVHSLAAGAWTKKKFISEAGGVFNGAISILADGSPIILQNDVQGQPLYLLAKDADGTNKFYIGTAAAGNNSVTLSNYKGEGNYVSLVQNGGVDIVSKNGLGTTTNVGYEVSEQTGSGSLAGQYTVKAPYHHEYDSTEVTYHPIWKEKDLAAGVMWHGGILSGTGDFVIGYTPYSGDGKEFLLKRDGSFVPENYTNFDAHFDARYDARYQKINAASKAVNGWFRDTNTGVISQWGTASGGADDAYYTVGLPIAFPSAFSSLQVLPIYDDAVTSGHVLAAHGSVKSLTQFGYGISNGASGAISANGVYWSATGYSATTKRNQKDFDHLEHFGFAEPAYFYSAINNAFYPSELFADYVAGDGWPVDAIQVEDSVYQEFAANPAPERMTRVAGDDGMPMWADIPRMVTAPANYQAQKDTLLKQAGGEIDVLRDVVKYAETKDVGQYADKLAEWEKYRANVYISTPEDAVNIPIPG